MCWRDTFRRRRCGVFWNNDPPPSDWRFPACPPGLPEWREVHPSGMTLFSSERVAGNPLCTLSARKMSAEALVSQVNHLCLGAFRARAAI